MQSQTNFAMYMSHQPPPARVTLIEFSAKAEPCKFYSERLARDKHSGSYVFLNCIYLFTFSNKRTSIITLQQKNVLGSIQCRAPKKIFRGSTPKRVFGRYAPSTTESAWHWFAVITDLAVTRYRQKMEIQDSEILINSIGFWVLSMKVPKVDSLERW